MKQILKNRKLWTALSVTMGSLLVVALSGKDIVTSQEASINHFLNIETFKTINQGDPDESQYFRATYTSKDALKAEYKRLASQAESEGLVMLKNDNEALPLAKNAKVSLFGTASNKFNYSVSGSSSTTGVTYPKVDDVFNEKGLKVNPTLMDFYRNGEGKKYGRKTYMLVGQANECPWDKYDDATLNSVKEYGDAAIVTFARDSGEGTDLGTINSDGTDGSYLTLSKEEKDLLRGLTNLKKEGTVKKIIVLINTSTQIALDFLDDTDISVDSILWVGNVGTYGLDGIADVLLGEVSPSGRLSDSVLKQNFTSPAMMSWMSNPGDRFSLTYTNSDDYELNETQKYYAVYQEGIYVGYKYYETRYADFIEKAANVGDYDYTKDIAYPFGYGLSYTEFSYSDFKVTPTEDGFEVSVKVTNTGDTYSGKEAIEIYLQKPYGDYEKENDVEVSAIELVGINKTNELAPGEDETLTVNIPKESFKTYDANNAKTYILSEGDYYLSVGRSSHEALNNILALKNKTYESSLVGAYDSSLATLAFTNDALDKTTYSKSLETNNPITNQLDFMDVNKYKNKGDNKVTYVSRKDWMGTLPTAPVELKVSGKEMAFDLSSNKPVDAKGYTMPKYRQNNGYQIVNLRSTAEETIPYDDPRWDELLDQMSFEEQSNLLTTAGFSTLAIQSVGKPATKDNDGPTAIVGTVTGSVLPSKGIIASTYNRELIRQIGEILAEDTRMAGYQSIYAPGVNIHRTPFEGRSNEYYSEDGYLSGIACVEEITGIQSKGVIPTIKHFAFNNEETNRNGIAIWMNEQEAREIMLKPYELALRPSIGNGHAIMTSFNRAGCIWTSASEELMININRGEFGFDGYSLTDMAASNAASYMVYSDAFANGSDLFLGTGSETALNEFRSNAKFATRMRDSAHRVLYVIANYSCAMNGIGKDSKIIVITPWYQVLINSLIGVFAGLLGVSIIFLGISYYKNYKEKEV